MEPAAIVTRDLVKRFAVRALVPGRTRAEVVALDGADLEVAAGTIHGLVGPNGSGKSTLLRVLATLVLPTGGSATVAGIDVARDPLAVRRAVGFSTGEERSVYWRLTARQNLEFYAALYGLARGSARIAELLELLELTPHADRPTSGFSQGMQRRLGLARALLHAPPVLILDEPGRSLDPHSREHFHDILRRLRDGGRSVLLSTHDLEEATTLCDRVTVLERGRVVGVVAGSGGRREIDGLLGLRAAGGAR